MSIYVFWYDDAQTIVHMKFDGKWSWEEVYQATQKSVALRKSKSYKVALILDMLRGAYVPSGALTHMRNTLSASSEDRELVVGVTTSAFLKTLVSMFTKLYGKLGERLFVVEKLEDAEAIIGKWRATQNADQA